MLKPKSRNLNIVDISTEKSIDKFNESNIPCYQNQKQNYEVTIKNNYKFLIKNFIFFLIKKNIQPNFKRIPKNY